MSDPAPNPNHDPIRAFDYWGEFRTGRATLHEQAEPRHLDLLDRALLDNLLTDPAVITGYTDTDDHTRAHILTRVALWLEQLPPHLLTAGHRSRAARLRFLIWSLPFRFDPRHPRREILPLQVCLPLPTAGAEPRSLELNETTLLELARTAREEWLTHLRTWQDDPWLSGLHQRDPARFERELRLITHTWPARTCSSLRRPSLRGPRRPDTAAAALSLVSPHAGPRERHDDHARVAADLIEAHWLPRGSLLGGAAATAPGDPKVATGLIAAFALLAPAPALTLLGLGALGRWVGLGQLAAGLILALAQTHRRDALLLLRLPAAAGAGALILLSFTPRWWIDPDAWRVGIGLTVAAWGYLVLETRLHGATLPRALLRGAAIGLVGLLTTLTLAVVVAGFIAPSVAEDGQCLLGWWTHDPYTAHTYLPPLQKTCETALDQPATAAPASMLTLLTGWSLAVGLAAQVLWDDRPVTAPLGRLRRTRGDTP